MIHLKKKVSKTLIKTTIQIFKSENDSSNADNEEEKSSDSIASSSNNSNQSKSNDLQSKDLSLDEESRISDPKKPKSFNYEANSSEEHKSTHQISVQDIDPSKEVTHKTELDVIPEYEEEKLEKVLKEFDYQALYISDNCNQRISVLQQTMSKFKEDSTLKSQFRNFRFCDTISVLILASVSAIKTIFIG